MFASTARKGCIASHHARRPANNAGGADVRQRTERMGRGSRACPHRQTNFSAGDMSIRGAKEHQARLTALANRLGPRISDALYTTGQTIQVDAQISITDGAKSGRMTRGERKKLYQSSAPGEAPAEDTADLVNSIEAVRVEPLKVEVRANDRKAAWLEFGTSKMLARPYMQPAVDMNRDTLKKNVTDAINAEIRKGGR